MSDNVAVIKLAAEHGHLKLVKNYDSITQTVDGVKVEIEFRTDDWNDLTKTVVFARKDLGTKFVLLQSDETSCFIPWEILNFEGNCVCNNNQYDIGVFGVRSDGTRIPTNKLRFKFLNGCYTLDSDPPAPTPGVYEQTLQALMSKSDIGHIHDDRYYTEEEINTLLNAKSDIEHNHDDKYYIKDEIDASLDAKSDVGHTHTFDKITDKPTTLAEYGINDVYTKTQIDETLIQKQDKLIAGANITIEDNVISSDGAVITTINKNGDVEIGDFINLPDGLYDLAHFISLNDEYEDYVLTGLIDKDSYSAHRHGETIEYCTLLCYSYGLYIVMHKNNEGAVYIDNFVKLFEVSLDDYATKDYVDANGGKIDKIIVNGVEKSIVNKTVEIEESDPTVPDWAKQPNKPTYTAQEVGALPSDTMIPTKVSDLTNDSGFATEEYVDNIIDNLSFGDANVQSDWNQSNETLDDYIKNKPFYEEFNTILFDFEGTADQWGYIRQEFTQEQYNKFNGFDPFVDGSEYIINLDGVEYTAVYKDWHLIFTTESGIDLRVSISEYPDGVRTVNLDYMGIGGTSQHHHVIISGHVIKPIDKKYLPTTLLTQDVADELYVNKELYDIDNTTVQYKGHSANCWFSIGNEMWVVTEDDNFYLVQFGSISGDNWSCDVKLNEFTGLLSLVPSGDEEVPEDAYFDVYKMELINNNISTPWNEKYVDSVQSYTFGTIKNISYIYGVFNKDDQWICPGHKFILDDASSNIQPDVATDEEIIDLLVEYSGLNFILEDDNLIINEDNDTFVE